MSILSVALAPRRRQSARALEGAEGLTPARRDDTLADTLADMVTGQQGYVVAVEADEDPAAARRLFDLGFVPGAAVQMVRKAPLADPVVFRVAGYDIALRREQARWVTVSSALLS
jgi:ferrous iron transport protein A